MTTKLKLFRKAAIRGQTAVVGERFAQRISGTAGRGVYITFTAKTETLGDDFTAEEVEKIKERWPEAMEVA